MHDFFNNLWPNIKKLEDIVMARTLMLDTVTHHVLLGSQIVKILLAHTWTG